MLRNENIIDNDNQLQVLDKEKRKKIADICKKKGVFKNIDGGKEFGKYVVEILKSLEDGNPAKDVMDNLKNWIFDRSI